MLSMLFGIYAGIFLVKLEALFWRLIGVFLKTLAFAMFVVFLGCKIVCWMLFFLFVII